MIGTRRLHPVVPLGVLLLMAVSPAVRAGSASVGSASDGELVDGFRLPLTHDRHRFYGPVRSRGTNYATLEMAALLVRAAEVVSTRTNGSPLVIGDASALEGGELPNHASHTSGRDVDLLFYVVDADKHSVTAKRFRSFDGHGRCEAPACDLRFDASRNWWLVRTLLVSQHPAVQWIFVSAPLRQRLLAWAEAHGEHPEVLARARRVLRQPSDAAVHDDHFHVRVYCTARDRKAGCEDRGPRWGWIDDTGRAEPIRPL